MVTLHVPQQRTALDLDVQQTLTDLVLAFSVEIADPGSVPVELPAILDGARWVPAPDLPRYLVELERDVASWRKFQSDACYIDDDGSIC